MALVLQFDARFVVLLAVVVVVAASAVVVVEGDDSLVRALASVAAVAPSRLLPDNYCLHQWGKRTVANLTLVWSALSTLVLPGVAKAQTRLENVS